MAKINRITRSSSSLVTLAELQSGSELFSKTTVARTQITPELTGTAALVKRAEVIRRVIDHIVYNDTVSGVQIFADYLLPADSALLLFIRGKFIDDASNISDTFNLAVNKLSADSLDLQDIITIIKISERFFQHSVLPQSQTILRLDKLQSEIVGIADQTAFNVNLSLVDQMFMTDVVFTSSFFPRSFQETILQNDVSTLDVVKSLQHDLSVQEATILYYAKNLIDVLAAVDTKILETTQLRTEVLNLEDTLNTAVVLNKNHAVTADDAIAQQISLTKFDDAILNELVGLGVFKSAFNTVAVSDATRNLLAKFFAENIIPVDLAGVFDGITYYYGLSRALNVAVGDEYRAAVTYLRSLQDTELISDAISNLVSKQFSHAVSATDVLLYALLKGLSFQEQINTDVARRLDVVKLLIDDPVLLDVKALNVAKVLADDNNILDVLQLSSTVSKTLADDNSVFDLVALISTLGRTLQDSNTILDVKNFAAFKTLSDDNNINDVLRLNVAAARTLADSAAIDDATAKNIGKNFIRRDQLGEPIGSLTQTNGVFTNSNIYDSSTSIVISAPGTGLGNGGGFPTWDHFRFASAAPRILTSNPIDFTKYPRIDFLYVVGNSSNGGENPDTNENLILEYFHVTNGWTTAVTIHAGGVVANNNARRGWTPFSFNLASTTSGLVSNVTRFRIRQPAATGTLDNYGVANLTLRGGEFALTQDYEKFDLTKLLRETATTEDLRVFSVNKIFADLSIVNDTTLKTLDKFIVDPALDLTDTTRFSLQYNFADTVITEDLTGIADGLNYSAVLSRAHEVSINDLIAQYLSIQLRSTDITVLDEISVLKLRSLDITDIQTIEDLFSLSLTKIKTIDSSVDVADSFAKVLGRRLIVSDSVSFYQPAVARSVAEGTTSNVQYVSGFPNTSWGTVATLGSQVCVLARASDNTSVGYRSTDRGLTWSTQDFILYDSLNSSTETLVFAHQQTSDRVTSVAMLHPLYQIHTSTDFGSSWNAAVDSWTSSDLDEGFYAPVWDQGRGAFFAWARFYVSPGKSSPAQYNWRHVYSSGATTQAGTRWSLGNTLVNTSGSLFYPHGSASGIPSSTSVPSTLLLLATGDVYAYQANNASIANSGVLVTSLTWTPPNNIGNTGYMTFGNGMFVVVDGAGRVHRSTSITTWNTITLPGSTNVDCHGVVWDTGLQQFIISAGGKGEGLSADKIVPTFYFSADAINWTSSYSRYSNVRYQKSGLFIDAEFVAFSGESSTGTSVLVAISNEGPTFPSTSIIRTAIYAGTIEYSNTTARDATQPSAMRYDVALKAKQGVTNTVQLKTIQTTNQYSSVFVTRTSADTDLVGSIDILKKDPALQKSDILVTADAERFSSTTIKRETVSAEPGGVWVQRQASAGTAVPSSYSDNISLLEYTSSNVTSLVFTNSTIWTSTAGVSVSTPGTGAGNTGGFTTYHHYRFDTSPVRTITSKLFTTSSVKTLNFSYIIGNTNGGDSPDTGENLLLQYLSSNGTTWLTYAIIADGNDTYPFWRSTSMAIAVPTSRFRFFSTGTLGAFDHYGVAEVSLDIAGQYGGIESTPIYGSSVSVGEIIKDVDLRMHRGVDGSLDLKTLDAVQSVPGVHLQSSVTVSRTSQDVDEVGAVDLFSRIYGTQQRPAENSGDLDPFGNINTMVSNGSLRMTDYVDIEYLENDYVGASRSFS